MKIKKVCFASSKDLQQQITSLLPKLDPAKTADLVSKLQGADGQRLRWVEGTHWDLLVKSAQAESRPGLRSSAFLDEIAKMLPASRFASSNAQFFHSLNLSFSVTKGVMNEISETLDLTSTPFRSLLISWKTSRSTFDTDLGNLGNLGCCSERSLGCSWCTPWLTWRLFWWTSSPQIPMAGIVQNVC